MTNEIKLIDIGSSEGLHHRWAPHLDHLDAYLFEPAPDQAQLIRDQYAGRNNLHVIEKALWDERSTKTLNIAAHFGCTSMRKPDLHILEPYNLVQFFDIVRTEPFECYRYADLHRAGEVPIPDAIKIDVQGCEYEVFQGFGDLIGDALSIELEAHVYPIYRGQHLLHDMIAFLDGFDFVLRTIHPTPHFKGDVIEVDALFLPNPRRAARLSEPQRQKLDFIKSVYGAG